ncbi:MAG: dTMP kinase [Fibrobacteres bacterium]|jgi:dTMP kinase|nr:dTMP kinase [Fibrobacterota bacterium]
MPRRESLTSVPGAFSQGSLPGGSPRFFSLEGIDGSGKSTQLALLADRLRAKGRETVTVREPGGTPVSDAIRQILLSPGNRVAPSAELLLFSAARAQLAEEVIAPALSAGKIVLADRFGWSTLAYQGYGRGLDQESIFELFRIACGPVWPLHSFLLDLPASELAGRLRSGGRAADRMESAGEEFFARVREGYRSIAKSYPDRFTVLDASLPPATLHEAIAGKLDRMLA